MYKFSAFVGTVLCRHAPRGRWYIRGCILRVCGCSPSLPTPSVETLRPHCGSGSRSPCVSVCRVPSKTRGNTHVYEIMKLYMCEFIFPCVLDSYVHTQTQSYMC